MDKLAEPLFSLVPKFTRPANYCVTIPWAHLLEHLETEKKDFGARFQPDPDFQRAHVWTHVQRTRYVEFVLRGGTSSRDILWNCVGWSGDYRGPYVLVDGKQRLQAALDFLSGNLKAFGYFIHEFRDTFSDCYFNWRVNNLETRAEVLQWYIDLNAGGVAHTDEEIDRVRQLLSSEEIR